MHTPPVDWIGLVEGLLRGSIWIAAIVFSLRAKSILSLCGSSLALVLSTMNALYLSHAIGLPSAAMVKLLIASGTVTAACLVAAIIAHRHPSRTWTW